VYAKTKSSSISLCDVWNKEQINLHLTRGTSIVMRQEKARFFSILRSLSFSSTKDYALWLWESTGYYSIQSMYYFLYIFLGVV
jgi:hypothetical protein